MARHTNEILYIELVKRCSKVTVDWRKLSSTTSDWFVRSSAAILSYLALS